MCKMVRIKTNFNTEIEVADIKKEVVENIIKAACVCSKIYQIILFGSVIESRCTENSDIDMLVVSDVTRSQLYRDKNYQEFLRKLHEQDDYEQLYDVICVHKMEELYKRQNTIGMFRDVLKEGKVLYRRQSLVYGRSMAEKTRK